MSMRDSTKTALAVLSVVVLAGAFWLLLLAPKRDKANELSERANAITAEVATEQSKLDAAVAAKKNFSVLYAKLVELGKAVPAEAATPSLLVQLEGIASRSRTSFAGITLGSQGGGGESSEAASPTEGSAQLPLGASLGASGLATMPYSLEFRGGFFEIAKFIQDLDSLVQVKDENVDATGRLVTIEAFSLAAEEESGSQSSLKATFQVTTYVTPSGQGLTAGATEGGPEVAPEPESTEAEAAP